MLAHLSRLPGGVSPVFHLAQSKVSVITTIPKSLSRHCHAQHAFKTLSPSMGEGQPKVAWGEGAPLIPAFSRRGEKEQNQFKRLLLKGRGSCGKL